MVATDAGGFPPTIVTTWVTLVELETMVRIPPHVEDGHTEWTFPWMRERRGGGERKREGRGKGEEDGGGGGKAGVEEGQDKAFYYHGERSTSFTQTRTSELSVRLLEIT